jgi:hypothetical protein
VLKDTELHSTPSHLSFLSLHDIFGILQQGIDLILNLDSFLGARGFTFNSSSHGYTITIAQSLRLK